MQPLIPHFMHLVKCGDPEVMFSCLKILEVVFKNMEGGRETQSIVACISNTLETCVDNFKKVRNFKNFSNMLCTAKRLVEAISIRLLEWLTRQDAAEVSMTPQQLK